MADPDASAEPKTPPTKPPEGIADHDEAEVRSIAPSVCWTPCGPTMVPVPYCIWDKHGHDQNYTPAVRWHGNAAMVLRSITQHVHVLGDEAGNELLRQSIAGADEQTHEGDREMQSHHTDRTIR